MTRCRRCRTNSTSTGRRHCAPKSCKSAPLDTQTFYQVKLIFPRGDAASLLFGFNAEGKITGIGIMSMAGD